MAISMHMLSLTSRICLISEGIRILLDTEAKVSKKIHVLVKDVEGEKEKEVFQIPAIGYEHGQSNEWKLKETWLVFVVRFQCNAGLTLLL